MQMPKPKFATQRNLENPSTWKAVALQARFLNTPLMPWQQYVCQVGLERQASHHERSRYQTVVVTVPRQAGKTTMIKALMSATAQSKPGCSVFYTAQTRKDAVEKWKELAKPLAATGKNRVKLLEGTGNEQLKFLKTDSLIQPFAPTPEGIHGKTSPLVVVDEAWAFNQAEGDDLMASFSPVGITLPESQVWIISTAGDTRSEWLKDLVERGRESVNDPASTMAFFEWSADEETAAADPYSDETLSFHPAIGITQEPWKLRAEAKNNPLHLWRRSYLNLWPTSATTSVIDLEAWGKLKVDPINPPSGCALCYDIADDRSGATVYLAWMRNDKPHLHLALTRAGAAWVPEIVTQLQRRLAVVIVADDSGTNRPVTAQLQESGLEIYALRPREYQTACADFLARITDAAITHEGNEEIETAMGFAVQKPVAGGLAFSARHSTGAIDSLKAAIGAAYGAQYFSSSPQVFF
ncbi:terminase large subunit domain-containing protein [uncultured Mobiluncus sp.]|uniref:terminase large subunit domain-containing protein n=1 Tax=uncultured Mobiluncus sp. TaxID=293425 RepID=UPI002634B53B|nr:terminase large subunit [uncultured Mobiluncus sp.]